MGEPNGKGCTSIQEVVLMPGTWGELKVAASLTGHAVTTGAADFEFLFTLFDRSG